MNLEVILIIIGLILAVFAIIIQIIGTEKIRNWIVSLFKYIFQRRKNIINLIKKEILITRFKFEDAQGKYWAGTIEGIFCFCHMGPTYIRQVYYKTNPIYRFSSAHSELHIINIDSNILVILKERILKDKRQEELDLFIEKWEEAENIE